MSMRSTQGRKRVDEPFDEADGLDGQAGRARQSQQPSGDFLAAFGVDRQLGDRVAVGGDRNEGDGGLVQIDADERLVSYDCLGHSESLRVRGRKTAKTQRKRSFRRPLHGFTLVIYNVLPYIEQQGLRDIGRSLDPTRSRRRW